ncbi:hypothetical protein AALB_3295 [Agarivorans albus MKT 106]|uniref:Uncharacterized protein n=1 Tax=Agarivorans albus MKT 106 TaxID=1331007 RepID=R9PPH9_AGAAL|nr:hypothetical protein AALB_3295 [Agarivorans albus MKT 106]
MTKPLIHLQVLTYKYLLKQTGAFQHTLFGLFTLEQQLS